ncbi:hypothetical protein BH23ACT11_BH23ACT11_29490 [soil metagenome]
MNNSIVLKLTTFLLTLLLVAGCSSGAGSGSDSETEGTDSTSGTTSGASGGISTPAPETTQESEAANEVTIEQISSGDDGAKKPQIVVAASAKALSTATNTLVPDSGEGTYLAAFWGEKPTGGYTVEVSSAWEEDGQIVVQLALKKPPPDAMVSQALTYPYAAAVTRSEVSQDQDFSFITQGDRELNWPVRRV